MTDPDPATTADVLRREERKRLYANGYQDGVAAERQRIRKLAIETEASVPMGWVNGEVVYTHPFAALLDCLSWIETLVLGGEGNE